MRVGGVWVGWGLGDESLTDMTVRNAKAFMRRKFPSYAGQLADTNLFDQAMHDAVWEMQRRYHQGGKLHAPTGILDLDTQIVMGFKQVAKVKPVLFTVEGHLSNMWQGPCAYTAQALEAEGLIRWQPVGYDSGKLPFNNLSGINELSRLLADTALLPHGTPWGMVIFSQGGIVGCETFLRHIRPASGKLHWRLKDLKAVVAYGNPYREKAVVAPWVPDPPKPNTQGISDVRMTNTPTYWREVSRTGDLYAENPDNEVGLNRSAIYKIVSESSWSGGPAGMLSRVVDLFNGPVDGVVDIARAIIGGAMFLGNMGPHGMYDLRPSIDFIREQLR